MLVSIVTYNPDEELLKRNLEILKRNDPTLDIVIVDNNSRKVLTMNSIDHLIRFPRNYGLGRAYNHVIGLAKEEGHEWVLLLDQDSVLLSNFRPSKVVKESNSLRDPVLLSINWDNCRPVSKVEGTNFHKTKLCANSGTIVNVDYGVRNPYFEELFVEMTDVEYYYRASRRGKYVYDEPMISHFVGEGFIQPSNICGEIYILLAKLHNFRNTSKARGLIKYSDPLRYYRDIRNTLYLLLRNRVWFNIGVINTVGGSLMLCDSIGVKGLRLWLRAILRAIDGRLSEDNEKLLVKI